MHCEYVDTDRDGTRNYGVLYTDKISFCSGLALWSHGRAGLIHIVPGTQTKLVETFLARYDNGSEALPQQVFVATWPEHASGIRDDDDASKTSLYGAARALLNYYGENIRKVTIIITGFRGRRCSHEAQLAVSAEYGVSIAIPGRGEVEEAECDLREATGVVSRLEESLGANHPKVLAGTGNLALLYYKQGKYRKAEIFFETLASDAERALGPQHPQVSLASTT